MSRIPAVLLLSALTLAAGCGASLAAAIQDPDMVLLPDPVLSKSVRFPVGAATQEEARVGPALDKPNVSTNGCSALNPCAVTGLRPAAVAAQRAGERRHVRRPG